jgi:hypothetical protein
MSVFKKTDALLQVVYSELYVPMIVDSQGDFSTAEEIRKACWRFMKQARTTNSIDVEHDGSLTTCYVVENFIARKGDPDFIADGWVLGIHIPDKELWKKVEDGELNGFSMEALGLRRKVALDVECPPYVRGRTCENDGHQHAFVVKFDPEGNFLGGFTEPAADGHQHLIHRGTVTEDAAGHNHRFSFIEGLCDADG